MSTPDITVVITAYNRKDFLEGAINSVLNQTLDKDKFEVIVVKNYSDEMIDNIIRKNGLKQLVMEGAIGKYLSAAAKASRGRIISFLDDDDKFVENKLEVVYNKFNTEINLVYLHNDATFISDDGKILNNSSNHCDFNLSSISVSKDHLNLQLIDKIEAGQDTFFYYMSRDTEGKVECIDARLTLYMRHGSRSSWTDFDRDLSLIIKEHTYWIKTMVFLYQHIRKMELKRELYHVITWNKIKLKILSNLNGEKASDSMLRVSAHDIVRFIIYPRRSDGFNRFKWIILLITPFRVRRNIMKRYFSTEIQGH